MIRLRDFDPLESVGDEGRVSFRARSKATGALLLIHLFRGANAMEGRRVLSSLPGFPSAERSRILDFGEDQGSVFFVTLDLPEEMSFSDWVDSVSRPGQPRRPPAPVAPPVEKPVPASYAAPKQPAPAKPPAETRKPAGEFTQFMREHQGSGPESTTTTEDMNGWLEGLPASERRGPSRRDPVPEIPRQSAPQSPMNWLEKPVAEPSPKAVFAPLFADETGPPPQRHEPAPRRRIQERRQVSEPPRPSPVRPSGQLLKPWLQMLGIILGVALLVVLVMRIL